MHYGLMSFHKISEESEDGRWCSTVFTCALPSCEPPQKKPLCPAARIGFVPEPFSQKFAWIFAAGFKSPAGMLRFPTIYETRPEISVIHILLTPLMECTIPLISSDKLQLVNELQIITSQ